jgi:hypothetical protein
MNISFASATAFFGLCAQVIPVLLLAILVDSSRGISALTTAVLATEDAKIPPKHSRRLILATIVGGVAEIDCLYNVLINSPSSNPAALDWHNILVLGLPLLAIAYLLYVVLAPHLEIHIAIVYRKRQSYVAWYGWAWVFVSGLLILGLAIYFAKPSGGDAATNELLNTVIAYILWVAALLGMGVLGAVFISRRLNQAARSDELSDNNSDLSV